MASYATWQTAIKTWLEASSGIQWFMENEPRPHLFYPYGIISGPSSDPVGQDYVTYMAVGLPVELIPRVNAQRLMTYGVRVMSRSQNPDERAGRIAELARMALRLPMHAEALNVAGLGLAYVGDLRHYDRTFDDRVESVASFDVVFNAAPSEDLAAGVDAGWIETVEIEEDVNI